MHYYTDGQQQPAHPNNLPDGGRDTICVHKIACKFYKCVTVYNQHGYADIPYPAQGYENATVATSGCGPCCASILAENMAGRELKPDTAAAWAISIGARVSGGTNMLTLSRALADRYKLKLTITNNVGELLTSLENGAMAVVNVGGNRKGYNGVFSDGGHYIIAAGLYNGKVIVADPGYYNGKYNKSWRRSVVVLADSLLLAAPEIIDKDAENRSPRYYIFAR